MLFLAVLGFTLMNVLGIVLFPRFTVCLYIWYTLVKWGYLDKGAPDWMGAMVVVLVLVTVGACAWDIVRGFSFLDNGKKIF